MPLVEANNQPMSLSVILPNFNHAEHLPRALRAMLRQGPALSEIVVVDDASTDNSVEVIETFQREYPIIQLIRHPQNQGAPAALNSGLRAAKSEFVYCGASDDFVLGGFFAAATAALTRFPQAGYFCAQVALVDQNGDIIGFRPALQPSRADTYVSPAEACRIAHAVDNWAVGQSVVFPRKYLLEIGGFDETLGSFCDGINYRLLAFRRGFYYSSHLAAVWEVRRDSLSAQSALSPAKNSRLIQIAGERIAVSCPATLGKDYPDLLRRRLRFNMARFALSAPGTDASAIADLVALGSFDSAFINAIGTRTRAGRLAILAWLSMRLRPFGFFALARAWLNNLINNHARRMLAARAIAEATK